MNELEDRWFWAYPTESVDCDGITGSANEVYSKSDVDKVIAEKDKKIQSLEYLCENYRCDCENLGIMTDKLKKSGRSLRQKMYHHKYKRCLAMDSYWVAVSYQCEDDKHRQSAERHRRKWLELASKFKDKETK